jgi:hypothetical protein
MADSIMQAHTEIGGHQYTCTKIPFTRAKRLAMDLTKEFGGTVFSLLSDAINEGGEMRPDRLMAVGLRAFLTESRDIDECERLTDAVMSSVSVGGLSGNLGDPKKQDAHFGDRDGMVRYFEVLRWAMGVQYRDFFGAPLSHLFLTAAPATTTGGTPGSPTST